MKNKLLPTLALMGLTVPLFGFIELTINGGFEAGDTSGWVSFPTGSSTFGVTGDAATGSFGGALSNTAQASAAVIKQANLGIGTVNPGDTVTISFDAKGAGTNGGVSFAEFFSEIDGGGVSSSGILGGAPLALTGTYQTFNFNAIAGGDVSGGVTLQLTATTGADSASTMSITVDNVSVSVVPEPGTFALILGAGSLGFLILRRRIRKS
jgi:hypothetical protein